METKPLTSFGNISSLPKGTKILGTWSGEKYYIIQNNIIYNNTLYWSAKTLDKDIKIIDGIIEYYPGRCEWKINGIDVVMDSIIIEHYILY